MLDCHLRGTSRLPYRGAAAPCIAGSALFLISKRDPSRSQFAPASVCETPMTRLNLQTLMCVLPQRLARLQRASTLRMKGLRLVLDGIEDPGNRAAVIRSAEAMGVLHIHVVHPPGGPIEGTKTAPNRSITTGSQKWVHLTSHSDVSSCVDCLRSEGFKIFAAKPENPGHPLQVYHLTSAADMAHRATRR